MPGAPIKFGARRHEGILRSSRRPGKLRGVGIFIGELRKPFVLALQVELIAKGGSRLFAVPSTYETSDEPTLVAAR